jgi:hypothetical protein
MNEKLLISLKENNIRIQSQIEKEIWTSEKIRRISSTFQQGNLDSVGIDIPVNKQRFLLTLYIALAYPQCDSWNALILLALEEKIRILNNPWLNIRIYSEFDTSTNLELLLLSPGTGYGLAHYYSIVNNTSFIESIRKIQVVDKKIKTNSPKHPQRKRGYSDKGSLRPKHLSTIWLEDLDIVQLREKIAKAQKVEQDLRDLLLGWIM